MSNVFTGESGWFTDFSLTVNFDSELETAVGKARTVMHTTVVVRALVLRALVVRALVLVTVPVIATVVLGSN